MSLAFIHPSALWFLLLIPLTVGLALIGPRRPTRGRFWGGLIMRVVLLTLVILALAGIQIRTPTDNLTVVFVLALRWEGPEAVLRIVAKARRRGEVGSPG